MPNIIELLFVVGRSTEKFEFGMFLHHTGFVTVWNWWCFGSRSQTHLSVRVIQIFPNNLTLRMAFLWWSHSTEHSSKYWHTFVRPVPLQQNTRTQITSSYCDVIHCSVALLSNITFLYVIVLFYKWIISYIYTYLLPWTLWQKTPKFCVFPSLNCITVNHFVTVKDIF